MHISETILEKPLLKCMFVLINVVLTIIIKTINILLRKIPHLRKLSVISLYNSIFLIINMDFILTYKYSKIIDNVHFNYKDTVTSLQNCSDLECNYENYSDTAFYDHNYKDIITGNLDFITVDKILKIMEYDTKFRFTNYIKHENAINRSTDNVSNLF